MAIMVDTVAVVAEMGEPKRSMHTTHGGWEVEEGTIMARDDTPTIITETAMAGEATVEVEGGERTPLARGEQHINLLLQVDNAPRAVTVKQTLATGMNIAFATYMGEMGLGLRRRCRAKAAAVGVATGGRTVGECVMLGEAEAIPRRRRHRWGTTRGNAWNFRVAGTSILPEG